MGQERICELAQWTAHARILSQDDLYYLLADMMCETQNSDCYEPLNEYTYHMRILRTSSPKTFAVGQGRKLNL